MNKTTLDFIQRLKAVRLSDSARADMRAYLTAYTDMHAVVPQTASVSFSFSTFFQAGFLHDRRMLAGLAAIVLVIGAGSATALAANQSVPGDTLYALKVSVNEPVVLALAPTLESRGELQSRFAVERVEEATVLAKAGKLDTQTAGYLEQQFSKQVDASNETADSLTTQGNVSAALTLRDDLHTAIEARAQTLYDFANTEPLKQKDAQVLLGLIDRKAENVDAANMRVADAFVPSVASSTVPIGSLALADRTEHAERSLDRGFGASLTVPGIRAAAVFSATTTATSTDDTATTTATTTRAFLKLRNASGTNFFKKVISNSFTSTFDTDPSDSGN